MQDWFNFLRARLRTRFHRSEDGDTVLPPQSILHSSKEGAISLPEPKIDSRQTGNSRICIRRNHAPFHASKMGSDGHFIQKGSLNGQMTKPTRPNACQFERSSVREASCPIIGRWILTQSDCSSKIYHPVSVLSVTILIAQPIRNSEISWPATRECTQNRQDGMTQCILRHIHAKAHLHSEPPRRTTLKRHERPPMVSSCKPITSSRRFGGQNIELFAPLRGQ